ncbi:DNA repair protein RadC [Candidatus Woesearchaeota archaeon]|nr:DNA repair protein RadC [Candidatus Woesearchaeota archaeon]
MNILSLPQDLRPRERLQKQGVQALSDAELLALLLRTGNRQENAVMLATRLLQQHSLASLSRARLADLQKLSGVGVAKACEITACFELSRRVQTFHDEKQFTISSPRDVLTLIGAELRHLTQEQCVGIYLNTRHQVIKKESIFVGTLNASLIHPREILRIGISEGAAAFILVHNHPSGDPQPSDEDVVVTDQLRAAGKVVGIEFLDHVIIGKGTYYSFKDEKRI